MAHCFLGGPEVHEKQCTGRESEKVCVAFMIRQILQFPISFPQILQQVTS